VEARIRWSELGGALAPRREALLERARAEADALRDSATTEGRIAIEEARRTAESLISAARAEGREEADEVLAAEAAEARGRAREVVLAAWRTAYLDVRREAERAIRELLAEPGRRSQMEAVLTRALGEGAETTDLPGGGITASTTDGRRVDASVDALVDAALQTTDLEQLWGSV
jgi:hypothetical protein